MQVSNFELERNWNSGRSAEQEGTSGEKCLSGTGRS